jgi:hypothetical protein
MSKPWTRTLVVVLVLLAVIFVATPKRVEADRLGCVAWYYRDVAAADLDMRGSGTWYGRSVVYWARMLLAETAYQYCVAKSER